MRQAYWVLAVAALTVSQAATAASSASASVTNLRFSLTDLNLTDGVLPSFSIVSGSSSVASSAASPELGEQASKAAPLSAFKPINTSASTDTSSAAAAVTAQGFAVSGAANGVQTNFSASANATSAHNSSMLRLSANSILRVSGTISAAASVSNGLPNGYYYNGDNASAHASVSLSYHYSANGATNSGSSSSTASAQVSPYYYYYNYNYNGEPISQAMSDSKAFDLFFVNTSSVDQFASFYVNGSVSGYGNSAPIPEADTYALALAGMGVVGMLYARRRKV